MKRYTGYLLAGMVLITALISHCSAGVACPFGSSEGGGFAGPFSSDSPGDGEISPFDDASAGGPADPFPDVSDASGIPCPFPQDLSSAGETGMTVMSETVYYPAPGDPDGDGYYEDLNGNGHTDFADLILYYNTLEWIRENQPLNCFDYNANGNIDFADMVILFGEV